MSAGELGSQLDLEVEFTLYLISPCCTGWHHPFLVWWNWALARTSSSLTPASPPLPGEKSCRTWLLRWRCGCIWVMWEAYLWILTSLTFRSLNHLVSIDVNGCPKWVWNISTVYLMLGSPQDDRQRYLYCGEALQEAEDGECYKLYLHKEDDKLPQNQKRAQVAF